MSIKHLLLNIKNTKIPIPKTNAGNAGILEQAHADTEAVIARALEGTMIEQMSREEFDTSEYVKMLLEGTKLNEILNAAEGLEGRAQYGASAVHRGTARSTAVNSLSEAKRTQESLNEDLRKNAARLAAAQAEKLVAEAIQSYMERLEAENKEMWNWQQTLVLGDGYGVVGKEISREAVVDSTIKGIKTERQTVYAYEYFETDKPRVTVPLTNLEGLDPDVIMQLVGQAHRELEGWGKRIFGILVEKGENEEAIPEGEEEYNGELARHRGKGPEFKEELDPTKPRARNIKDSGEGELGKILLDFQWNSIKESYGWAEAAKPIYDQKFWISNTKLDAPSIRSSVTMGGQIAGAIVSSVWPGWGTLLSFGINMTNDLLFASLDTAATNKDNKEIWAEFGVKTAINAGSTALSFGVGAVGEAIKKSGANAWVQGAVMGSINTVNYYTTTVAESYIHAYDFKNWEWNKEALEEAKKSWYSASTIAGALGVGVVSGFNTVTSFSEKIKENKLLGKTVSFGTSMAGEVTKYGVHLAYNLADRETREEGGIFAKSFDDMGGLTFSVNAGLLVDMISTFGGQGTGQLSDNKIFGNLLNLVRNIGYEVTFTSSNINGKFVTETGGIDVSGLLFEMGRSGVNALNAHNAAKATETARMMREAEQWKNPPPMEEIPAALMERERERAAQEEQAFQNVPNPEPAENRNGIAPPLGLTWDEFHSFPMTSPWGPRNPVVTPFGTTPPGHDGMDYGVPEGTRVNAVGEGIVVNVRDDPTTGFGLAIIIRHPSGNHSRYAHLGDIFVTQGQNVGVGQHIGNSGNTGLSTNPHLHFGWDGNGDGVFSYTNPADNPMTIFNTNPRRR